MEQLASQELSIESKNKRINDVQRYLIAKERFERASEEFNDACRQLRITLTNPERFLVQINFSYYLVTSDDVGNFDVEMIKTL